MKTAIILAVIFAEALSIAGVGEVIPVRNVRVGHMSSTDVNLYWDWSQNPERYPQFAVSYEQVDVVTPKLFAPLKVRAGAEYRMQIVTLLLDSGRWIQSEPTFINVTALAEDWPTPKNLSATVVHENDDNIVYSITWDMRDSENFTGSTVKGTSDVQDFEVRTYDKSLNYTFTYGSVVYLRVIAEYNIDLGNGTSIVTMRRSSALDFMTPQKSAPSTVLLWVMVLAAVLLVLLTLLAILGIFVRFPQRTVSFQPLLKPELEPVEKLKEAL